MDLVSLFWAIYILLCAIAIILLIYDDRDADTTLVWILAIILLPFIGLPLYYFLGRDWHRNSKRRKKYFAKKKDFQEFFVPFYEKYLLPLPESSLVTKSSRLISRYCETAPVSATSVSIYPSGKLMFDNLKKDLKQAKEYIVLQYFIWEKDELTAEITKILLEKLKKGVEVYLMYDFFGSIRYSKSEFEELKKQGAFVKADVTNLNMINYRNHRKIAVIDGKVGYTGGLNVGQEYIDGGKRFATWRDEGVRVEGPIVSLLLAQFATRIYERANINLYNKKYFKEFEMTNAGIPVQVAFSSVDVSTGAIGDTYANAIANAKERAWLQSPYFVPTEHLYQAMIDAASTGVDVRLMIAGVPDKKLVWYAAFTFLKKLLKAGVRVYLYEAGFMHTKMASFDGELCSIGTCNLDTRSLLLHDELTLFFYDRALTRKNDRIFLDDIKKCRELTLKDLSASGRLIHFRNSIARLFSKVI